MTLRNENSEKNHSKLVHTTNCKYRCLNCIVASKLVVHTHCKTMFCYTDHRQPTSGLKGSGSLLPFSEKSVALSILSFW